MMTYHHILYLFWLLAITASITLAQDKNETQDPDYNCIGGPAFGLEAACDFNNFKGLQGRSPSEIIYEIIMQAQLPNDTFYPNEEHVTCLFKDTDFILDVGAEAKGVGFTIEIDHPGTICAFVKDVPEGGLTLGEIRVLARALIRECEKCGRMRLNYVSKNESQLGWLEFDWRNNAICQDNCIDPEKDLKLSNSTAEEDSDGTDEDDEDDENGAGSLHGFSTSGVTYTGFLGFWFMAYMAL
ncbi:hypothetical protein ACJ41O_010322 [Fusarium nematophilum]